MRLARDLVVLAVTLAPSGAPSLAVAEPPPLTHTTPLTPTGEIVPAGHIERIQALTTFYHQLAIGLGDGFELRGGFPILPAPLMGADLELRWAPLAPGPLALVVGAGGTAEWVNGADLWVGGSTTLAWREQGWSLHATVRASSHVDGDDHLSLLTAGGTVHAGRTLLFAEVGEVEWSAPVACVRAPTARGTSADVSCTERHAGDGVWVGAWWDRGRLRGGLSALVVRAGGMTLPILPLLSFAWDYD